MDRNDLNKKKKIIINGAVFGSGKKIGVPRYSEEIIKALDKIKNELDTEGCYEIQIVTPVKLDFELCNCTEIVLKPEKYAKGKLYQELWRQFDIVNFTKRNKGFMVDLGMMVPLRQHDVTVIHDCQPEHIKAENKATSTYSKTEKFRLFQRRQAAKKSKLLLTVSEFSKNDIANTFDVPVGKIGVVPNAWQHFIAVQEDDSIIQNLPERYKYYCFALGSRYKHKNTKWIIEAAKQNQDILFVVSGYNDVADYSEDIENTKLDNLVFTGYVTDGQAKSLMRHARAFLQPSFNEGFGIPPLEALSVGTEIILANAAALPGVYGGSAHYIEPAEYENINIEKILQSEVTDPQITLDKYSWEKSARLLWEYIIKVY